MLEHMKRTISQHREGVNAPLNCTNCGAEAVKTEDFAVIDEPKEDNPNQQKQFRGYIRFTLCRPCMEQQCKANSRFNVISGFVLGVVGVLAAAFGIIIYLQKNMDWQSAFQTIFAAGVAVFALVYYVPKVVIENTKKKRIFNEMFEALPISQLLSKGVGSYTDYDKLTYKLLYDKQSDSRDPGEKLTKNEKCFRYYFPMEDFEEGFKRKFNIDVPPEDLENIMKVYGQLTSSEQPSVSKEESPNG